MQRRSFIKTTSALLAGSALASKLPAFAAEESSRSPQGRITLPINRNWRYSKTPSAEAHGRDFDDSAFERVAVPHSNVRLPWHSFDDKDYEFISVYRRRFRLPKSAQGRRVFVDFEGVMTASTVWINGTKLGEYKGGYTPFSFELTEHVSFDRENVLVVDVDSTERADIPPFGHEIDYMTFGGIYREVALRIVNPTYIENIHARTIDVLSDHPSVEVDCFVQHFEELREPLALEVELRDGDRTVAKASAKVGPAKASTDRALHTVKLSDFGKAKIWSLSEPNMYTVAVRLVRGNATLDSDTRRLGFREAQFTDHGFELNGEIVKLRGLDRHQTFPFVGQAMPRRVQRQDADILRKNLKCNIVRTSHYPQSRHFLDRCDEIGLLVLEEIPGWQHIGDESWKEISIDNVGRMIRRDWNHPSIILWGVRINESKDDHSFYTRTNAAAHELDKTRQTGGIRYFQSSEFLEDVFTMNDFGFPLKPPVHGRYLNTEFVGHTFPTKTTDDDERQREHTLRHARIHNQLASNPQYAGGIGWCAFDYNTHADFGAGDRICYHGVTDIFREPKAAAGFYKSQCDPKEEVVLEPAFHWARSDESTNFTTAVVCSNCDQLRVYRKDVEGQHLLVTLHPNREDFPHLRYPPFMFDAGKLFADVWGDLHIEGDIGGKPVVAKTFSGRGVDRKFALRADDLELLADGADTTRVVLRVTDEFDAIRPYANDPIAMSLEGPAELIGDNPFALIGGTGAIWIRAKETAGTVRLSATHPGLGTQKLEIAITNAPAEEIDL